MHDLSDRGAVLHDGPRRTSTRTISNNGERGARTIIRLPIAIIPCTPIDGDNPGSVPIVVPVIVISVVMPSVIISVIPSMVIIGRSGRRNKTGNTERYSKD